MPRKRIPQSVDVADIDMNASKPEIAVFAKTLNQLLEKKEMHQSEFVKKTGIAAGTISDYRNGKQAPGLVNLIKMADCLGVDCHYLATGVQARDYAVASELGLSGDSIEKLAAIRKSSKDSAVWSCGSDFWSNTLRFLNFLIEGAKCVYSKDEPNIISIAIKAQQAMEAASNIKKTTQLLNSKLALSDAEVSDIKNFDFTEELLNKESDRAKVLDEVRKSQDVYDAKLYHCEKMAGALIAEYIKKGEQNG